MKKSYKPIPYEIFLSELYLDLQEYFHPEKKQLPVFRIYTENIDYIIKRIEETSDNRISISRDTSYLKNYNLSDTSGLYTLFDAPISEDLYPPYFHPLWRKYIKDGILSYMFDNQMNGIIEYFNKSDIKYMKYSRDHNLEKSDDKVEKEDIPTKTLLEKLLWWKK